MKNRFELEIDEKASLEQRLEALKKHVRTLQNEVKNTQEIINNTVNPNQTDLIKQIDETSADKKEI